MFFSKQLQISTQVFERTNPFGLTVALSRSLLAMSTLVTLLFNSTNTLFPSNIQDTIPRSYIGSINLFYLFFHSNIFGLKIFSIAILLLVISGWRPRFTGILHWWVSYTFFTMSDLIDGGDQINAILCFIIMPITLMDTRKNQWRFYDVIPNVDPYKNILGNTIILLAGVQMSYLYFQSLVEKLKIDQWVDGTSLYYWLTHNIFGAPEWIKFIILPLLQNGVTLLLITWVVLIIELLLFAAIFMSKSRKVKILIIGILFHLSIALIHGLISFFFSMSAGLVLYLLPNDKSYGILFTRTMAKMAVIVRKMILTRA